MKLLRKGLTAVAVALSVGGVLAGPVFDAGPSTIKFKNFENQYRAIDPATGTCVGCLGGVVGDPVGYLRIDPTIAGNVKVGDKFIGILNVDSVTSSVSGFDTYNSAPLNRFTGYFAQEVKSITPPPSHVGPFTAHITLGTTADPFGILLSGEMFRLYSDVPSFTSGGSGFDITTGKTLATAGTLWASLGLGSEGYAYTHTDLTVTISTSNTINFSALDVMVKGGGYSAGFLNKINDFNEDEIGGLKTPAANQLCSAADIIDPTLSCTDLVGTSKIQQNQSFATDGSGTSPWMYQSDDPFDINKIPEPGSLALMGAALAGLGLVRRRRSV